jgi:predicted deacylase
MLRARVKSEYILLINMNIEKALSKLGEKTTGYIEVGRTSVNTYRIPVVIISGAKPGKTVGFLAGTHGTEYASIEGLIRATKDLDPSAMTGNVIAVTVLNGPHFEHRSAFLSPIDQLNQNRQFPGDPDGTLSRRTAYVVFKEVVSRSDALVDLHGGDIGEDIDSMVIAGSGGGEEVDAMALDMARCFPTEYISRLPETVSGLSMIAQKEYGIPCVTSEAGTPYPVRERHIQFHYYGIMNVLKYFGVLLGAPVLVEAEISPKGYRCKANNGGIWHSFHELGARVKKGDALGEVTDLFGNVMETYTAPENAKVTFLRTFYSVNQGEALIGLTVLK